MYIFFLDKFETKSDILLKISDIDTANVIISNAHLINEEPVSIMTKLSYISPTALYEDMDKFSSVDCYLIKMMENIFLLKLGSTRICS